MKPETRKRVASVLRQLPFSSEIVGPPKGFYRDTREWFDSGPKVAPSKLYQEVFPAFRGSRRQPVGLNDDVPWQFYSYYGGGSINDPPSWVAEIPKGRVFGNGAVVTPDDCLLGDVSREFVTGGDQKKHSIFSRIKLPRPQRISGRIAVLSVVDVSYWHWFFDLLPRILLLEKYYGDLRKIDAFVMNQITKSYQRETLEMLGFPIDRIIESHRNALHLKADMLIVSSVFRDVPAKWACGLLRDRLTCNKRTKLDSCRLLVSRSDAKVRRILNEDEIMEKLGPLGFQKVTLSGMSIENQRGLFASAEIVVAPHGAGLTNMLFSGEGTPVVEIYPPTYVNPCYWALSENLGLDYYYAIGEGPRVPPPPHGENPDIWFWSFVDSDKDNRQNIRVKVEELVTLVERALANS